MITTAIIYDHRYNGNGKNEQRPVEIRVTANRKSVYIATGIRVRPSQFLTGTIIDHPEADDLNRRLRALARRASQATTDIIAEGMPITSQNVRQRVLEAEKREDSNAFILWVEEQIPQLNVSEATRQHYVTMLARLMEYGQLTSWADITIESIYKWDNWLHSYTMPQSEARKATNSPKRKLCDGTVHNYHKTLKAMITRACRTGVIHDNPYDRLRGEFPTGDVETVEFLTDEEMQLFMSIHPTECTRYALAHDMFTLQMYTGLSFSDASVLKLSDYTFTQGKWIRMTERKKTKTTFFSQLLPPAIAILNKYGGQAPPIALQKYNKALKIIGTILGFNKKLTSHVARHTFATWALHNGVPIEVVSRMLGHTNITMTQRYAKVLGDDISRNFDILEKSFDK